MNDESNTRPPFPDRLELLRALYRRRLAGKADRLDCHIASVRARDRREDAEQAIITLVHRLAGTAGSYGIHEVSAVANQLEPRVRRGRFDEGVLARLEALAATMRRCSREVS